MKKLFYTLLPFTTVWILFYWGHFLPWDKAGIPNWWEIPLILTGIGLFAATIIVAIDDWIKS